MRSGLCAVRPDYIEPSVAGSVVGVRIFNVPPLVRTRVFGERCAPDTCHEATIVTVRAFDTGLLRPDGRMSTPYANMALATVAPTTEAMETWIENLNNLVIALKQVVYLFLSLFFRVSRG